MGCTQKTRVALKKRAIENKIRKNSHLVLERTHRFRSNGHEESSCGEAFTIAYDGKVEKAG
jgi:hypothetical protein